MTAWALLCVVALGILAALALLRGRRAPITPVTPPVDRAEALCEAVTGTSPADGVLLNQLLTLGPRTIPVVLAAVRDGRRLYEPAPAAKVARLEALVADFGLAAVPEICAALGRLQPTAPMAPPLTRILFRLGPGGLKAVFARAATQPELAPFVPRIAAWGAERGPAALLPILLNTPARKLPAALDALVGAIMHGPKVIDDFWESASAQQRAVVLIWMRNWRPLARLALVEAGLADDDAAVQLEAARLARLLRDPSTTDALRALCAAQDAAVRRAAVRALAALPLAVSLDALSDAAAHPDLEVAVPALLALRRQADALATAFDAADEVRGTRIGSLFEADVGTLVGALEALDPLERRVSISLLADQVTTDPRARERLIRIAESEEDPDRLSAILALADAEDGTAPDLLARVLKSPLGDDEVLGLQVAALRIGQPVVAPIARRLRANQGERAQRGLSVLRSVPYFDAVPSLLRGLEDARSGHLEGLLAATLRLGGPEVSTAIAAGLEDPRRGLLHPALRYLSVYGQASELPLLFELFEQHRLLRPVLLNLIETHGEAALPMLEAHIERGGEDATLAALERRRDLLKAGLASA